MFKLFTIALVALCLFISNALAYTTIMKSNTQECYYERMKQGEHFSITFETAGKFPIDFMFKNSINNPVYSIIQTGDGSYSYTSTAEGRHSYCFTNLAPHEIVVNFNPHGPEDEAFLAPSADASPAENEVRKLSHNVEEIKDHFNFMLFRNTVHDKSVADTQKKMFNWAILQTLVLAGVCGWQIYYVRSLFKIRGIV